MSDLLLALAIVAALAGAAWGLAVNVLRVRLKALQRLAEPGLIRRSLAAAWDEGHRASGYEPGAWGDDNPYRAHSP